MKINLSIDISGALKIFDTVTKKISYATNSALTRVAKECADAGQKELAADFTIRKRFILSRLRILKYSKVNNLTTTIGIDAKVVGSPLLLPQFEEGGTKNPQHGSQLAVPITGGPARPSFNSAVRSALKYQNLHIVQGKGWHRTYVVPGVGIFERVNAIGPRQKGARKPSTTVLIYKFERSAPLHKTTHIVAVMTDVVNARFPTIWAQEFDKEVARYLKKKRG